MISHFGIPAFGSVSRWNPDSSDRLTSAIHDFPLAGVLRSLLPTSAWKWLSYIPHARFQEIYASDSIIHKVFSFFCSQISGSDERTIQNVVTALSVTKSHLDEGKMGSSEQASLATRLIEYHNSNQHSIPQGTAIAEMMAHL